MRSHRPADRLFRRRFPGSNKALLGLSVAVLLMAVSGAPARAQAPPRWPTKVVLLGTGNPKPDPDRSGPATAIIVNGTPYLIDFGPGVVRRAAAAAEKGVAALEPTNLRVVFLTHLHSDHTAGYPDLILTPWVMGRSVPLEVYGPKGLKNMTDHILAAYQEDITIRTEGMEHATPNGYKVNVHEISGPGVVYKDANVTVTAFRTKHGEWLDTFGYRFDAPDRSIVITGDTIPTQATIDACHGCDVLIHEVLPLKQLINPIRSDSRGFDRKAYAEKYHTTTVQLAELASKAKPGMLILYHTAVSARRGRRPFAPTASDLLSEIKSVYSGTVFVGNDLDVY